MVVSKGHDWFFFFVLIFLLIFFLFSSSSYSFFFSWLVIAHHYHHYGIYYCNLKLFLFHVIFLLIFFFQFSLSSFSSSNSIRYRCCAIVQCIITIDLSLLCLLFLFLLFTPSFPPYTFSSLLFFLLFSPVSL